jgi:hypothetical protein
LALAVMAAIAATGLGIGLTLAATPSGGTYEPIAPAADLVKLQSEHVAELQKLAAKEPEKRRTWSTIRNHAWIVAETANLLTLQKDKSGDLPKQAGAVAKAATALGMAAKKKEYAGVPEQLKAVVTGSEAIGKLVKSGEIKPTPSSVLKPVAPLEEYMEVNQACYDRVVELTDAGSLDDKAYAEITHRGWLLAESGNLLLLAEENAEKKDWQGWSMEMRKLGRRLVDEAGKKDAAAIKMTIKAVDANCIACHDEYQ